MSRRWRYRFRISGGLRKCCRNWWTRRQFRIVCATHSPVLLDAPGTYVINLDEYINKNILPTDLGVEGASTIQ